MIWTELRQRLLFLYKNPDVWSNLREPASTLSPRSIQSAQEHAALEKLNLRLPEGPAEPSSPAFRNCLDTVITERKSTKELQRHFQKLHSTCNLHIQILKKFALIAACLTAFKALRLPWQTSKRLSDNGSPKSNIVECSDLPSALSERKEGRA
jgi:hypothetical protein